MLDLGPFSSENFDAKKWINSATQSRHPQDSLDNHLVDLEMKLQMVSEEIAASLEEQSASALLRVPRANRDVVRLRDDAASLRSVAAGILQKLKKAEGSSAESIAALAKVDTVKQRMEAAYETLQDAAGLTQLSSTVEDAFASGDLPRAAETLANMRHCLSAVGKVTEFAYVRKQLEVLEDRLDSMVQMPYPTARSDLPAEPCLLIIENQALEFMYCVTSPRNPICKTDRRIRWQKPPAGWKKLNTDGSSMNSLERAGCGGIVRDERGGWVVGFARHIGSTNNFVAEVWGLRDRLVLCCNMNISCLIVEIDAKVVVDVFKNPDYVNHVISSILGDCRQLAS